MVSRNQILSLYHSLLKNAHKFHNYNFREFAKRRIIREFRMNRSVTDSKIVDEKYQSGLKELEVLKRQVIISSLYPEAPSVIEAYQKK
jgi:hypothetical protein